MKESFENQYSPEPEEESGLPEEERIELLRPSHTLPDYHIRMREEAENEVNKLSHGGELDRDLREQMKEIEAANNRKEITTAEAKEKIGALEDEIRARENIVKAEKEAQMNKAIAIDKSKDKIREYRGELKKINSAVISGTMSTTEADKQVEPLEELIRNHEKVIKAIELDSETKLESEVTSPPESETVTQAEPVIEQEAVIPLKSEVEKTPKGDFYAAMERQNAYYAKKAADEAAALMQSEEVSASKISTHGEFMKSPQVKPVKKTWRESLKYFFKVMGPRKKR